MHADRSSLGNHCGQNHSDDHDNRQKHRVYNNLISLSDVGGWWKGTLSLAEVINRLRSVLSAKSGLTCLRGYNRLLSGLSLAGCLWS
jgi:hypothetical protein